MQCTYLDQNLTKNIVFGFLGSSHSGAWKCVAHNKAKLTNQYVEQVCRKNNAHNCMNCNFHPVKNI